MADLKEKRVELILQQLEDLPTLPAVAVRLLEVTADEKASVAEVVSLISSDPSLTARLLQLVHRADVGVHGEVKSIERLCCLGLKQCGALFWPSPCFSHLVMFRNGVRRISAETISGSIAFRRL